MSRKRGTKKEWTMIDRSLWLISRLDCFNTFLSRNLMKKWSRLPTSLNRKRVSDEDEGQSYLPLQKLAKMRCEVLRNVQLPAASRWRKAVLTLTWSPLFIGGATVRESRDQRRSLPLERRVLLVAGRSSRIDFSITTTTVTPIVRWFHNWLSSFDLFWSRFLY